MSKPKLSLTYNDFEKNIKERGKGYYESNMVGKLYNINKKYLCAN